IFINTLLLVLIISKATIITNDNNSALPNKPPYKGVVVVIPNNSNDNSPYDLENYCSKYCKYRAKTYKGKKYTNINSKFEEYNKY
ncbi:hypothetical protein OFC13_29750, partial [Escherichia coli]|nr:hypothetical protein [Escherichia coli]